jgi:muramoyltetrapeptide carboxypeptidase
MERRQFNRFLAFTPAIAASSPYQIMRYEKATHKIIRPKALKKGDTIGFISPGSPVKKEKFEIAVKNMENLGLKVKYTDTVLRQEKYLAGTDEERLLDIHSMFEDDEVKAIWCLRGGYGCTRLIDKIDYRIIKKNPKILIGYSDITALLLAIFQETGLVGFHGPVASSQLFTEFTSSQVQKILFGFTEKNHLIPFQPQSEEKYVTGHEPYVVTSGSATGYLTGGNLSLLVCLPNTPFAPSYKDKIVFIEDLDEKPYRIDRMLTFLLSSTDLCHAAGIVLGVWHNCDTSTPESSFTLKEVFEDRLGSLGIPCFYGHTFGHVTDICTFPIGVKAYMDTSSLDVKILENAVV